MSCQDEDKSRRAKVAHELDRREFWKSCFKIAAANTDPDDHDDIQWASKYADAALTEFEIRFPPLCGSS